MVFGTGGQTHRGIPGWAVIHRIIGSSDLRRLFLGLRERKKSLGEILFKMLLRKKYFREIAILNRFLDRLGPQILHEDFLQDFLPTGN